MSLSGNSSVAFMPSSRRPGFFGMADFSRAPEGGVTGSAVMAGGYAAGPAGAREAGSDSGPGLLEALRPGALEGIGDRLLGRELLAFGRRWLGFGLVPRGS